LFALTATASSPSALPGRITVGWRLKTQHLNRPATGRSPEHFGSCQAAPQPTAFTTPCRCPSCRVVVKWASGPRGRENWAPGVLLGFRWRSGSLRKSPRQSRLVMSVAGWGLANSVGFASNDFVSSPSTLRRPLFSNLGRRGVQRSRFHSSSHRGLRLGQAGESGRCLPASTFMDVHRSRNPPSCVDAFPNPGNKPGPRARSPSRKKSR